MFKGPDGNYSTSKIIAFGSFLAFIIISFLVLYKQPEKFDYSIFATLSAGIAGGLRGLDKFLNVKNDKK